MEYRLHLKGKFLFNISTKYSFDYENSTDDKDKLLKEYTSIIVKKLKLDLKSYIKDYSSDVIVDREFLTKSEKDEVETTLLLSTEKNISAECLEKFKFNYNDYCSASSISYSNGSLSEISEKVDVSCTLNTDKVDKLIVE